MLRIRNYFIAIAVVFAISSAYAVVGVQDAKAQSTMGDLIKRIEALESKGGGNVTAPKSKGLKISGHIRTRFEANANFFSNRGSAPTRQSSGLYTRTISQPIAGYTSSGNKSIGVKRSHNFVSQRIRLGFDFDINENVRAHAMIDSNRAFGGDQSTIQGSTDDTASMKQAYFELRNLGDISSILDNVSLLVGRKQWAYGDQRLIGHLNWTNVGRTHDGIIAKWKKGKNWVDVFISQIGTDGAGAGLGQDVADNNRVEYLYGFWGHFQNALGVEGILAEPYLFINDAEKSTVDGDNGFERWFGGLRLVGKKMPGLPGIDFSVEPTWQWGEEEKVVSGNGMNGHSVDISAFGIGVKAGYTFSNIPWSPRVGYEFEYASGDDKPHTSTKTAQSSSKTFDNLYPLGHAHLGYMDMHGFQNIVAHAVRLSAKPSKKLLLKADLWFFEADEEADSLYSVAGTTSRFGADQVTSHQGTVNVDDEYGQELDLVAKYKLFKNVGVVGGYSHYFTGDFMEDTNHGTQPGMDWFWLQAAVKF